MSELLGKVAVVTGASRGIGEAIAKKMAGAGARVALASRKTEGLARVANEIRSEGGIAWFSACHTGKVDEVQTFVARASAELGPIDILVNNAATNPYFGPMMNLEWGAWEKTFEVNVKGYFAMTRAVVEPLLARKSPGSIIHVASVLGQMAAPLQGVYGMTKAAVLSMTKTLAVELGSAKIRVNAIAPGLIETKFSQALVMNDEIRTMIVNRTAVGRVGQPEDVAGAALFLASDASAYVTGTTLVVDGGWTAS